MHIPIPAGEEGAGDTDVPGGEEDGAAQGPKAVCSPFPPKLELFILHSKPNKSGNFPSALVMPLVHGTS